MFINLSNHASAKWSAEQLAAARQLGGDEFIRDIQFPNVPPAATASEVGRMAETLVAEIPADAVVMVMGELTLTHAIVGLLGNRGQRVVAATTERKSVETAKPDGSVEKTTIFDFVAFRDYE